MGLEQWLVSTLFCKWIKELIGETCVCLLVLLDFESIDPRERESHQKRKLLPSNDFGILFGTPKHVLSGHWHSTS